MTKDELSAALSLARKIQRLQAALADLRAGGLRATGTTAPVQGGPGVMHPGQLASELEQEITALTREWEVEREIIRRGILRAGLTELEERVMLLRYVDSLPWREVAKAVGYSKAHTLRVHESAFRNIIKGE